MNNNFIIKDGVLVQYAGHDEKVIIPDGVIGIESEAFMASNCMAITEIVIPDSVRYIGEYAFAQLGLRKIKLPEGLKRIGWKSFYQCYKLKNIVIPENVTEIGREAFFGCRSLTKINIPESVKEIGDYAFAECDKLSLSVDPKILAPGSDIFGSTYGVNGADEITDEEADMIISNATS